MALRQEGRVTYLARAGAVPLRVALTHPGAYPQGLDAPFAARLITEVPGHFVILTDTFHSNPGNVQGQCGGSPTGERYLHVVALAGEPHETLSVITESCWLNVIPAHDPQWNASAGTLTLDLLHSDKGPLHAVYRVAADGTVHQQNETR